MKSINNYIFEALIKKDTSLVKHTFDRDHIIFIPYDDNFYYMARKYKELEMEAYFYTIYLIERDNAINIINDLPIPKISTRKDIINGQSRLTIFRIPNNIKSKEDLQQAIDDCGSDSPFDPYNLKCWELIQNINQLK